MHCLSHRTLALAWDFRDHLYLPRACRLPIGRIAHEKGLSSEGRILLHASPKHSSVQLFYRLHTARSYYLRPLALPVDLLFSATSATSPSSSSPPTSPSSSPGPPGPLRPPAAAAAGVVELLRALGLAGREPTPCVLPEADREGGTEVAEEDPPAFGRDGLAGRPYFVVAEVPVLEGSDEDEGL